MNLVQEKNVIKESGKWAAGKAVAAPQYVIGVDEAGRGPLAGPVVVAAVCLKLPQTLSGGKALVHDALRDSKVMSEKDRDQVFSELVGASGLAKSVKGKSYSSKFSANSDARIVGYAVEFVSPREIDEKNILRASLDGMHRACLSLIDGQVKAIGSKSIMLFDGPYLPHELRPPKVPTKGSKKKNLKVKTVATKVAQPTAITSPLGGIPAAAVIKGDSKSSAIAAASVLAKVSRDAYMTTLDSKHPGYGFAVHKGYPTPQHLEALSKVGPSEHHRETFAPVKSAKERFEKKRVKSTAKKAQTARKSKARSVK